MPGTHPALSDLITRPLYVFSEPGFLGWGYSVRKMQPPSLCLDDQLEVKRKFNVFAAQLFHVQKNQVT